jgi:hypothetical protein
LTAPRPDLNPFLMALAVVLIVLNLTLYIGMAAAGGASAASMRRPVAAQRAVAYPAEANFGRGALRHRNRLNHSTVLKTPCGRALIVGANVLGTNPAFREALDDRSSRYHIGRAVGERSPRAAA